MSTIKSRTGINWKWQELPLEQVFKNIATWIAGIDLCDLETSKSELKNLLHSVDFYLQVFEAESITNKYRITQLDCEVFELKKQVNQLLREREDNHKQINSLIEFKLKYVSPNLVLQQLSGERAENEKLENAKKPLSD